MHSYIFLLGRKEDLSFAELTAVLKRELHPVEPLLQKSAQYASLNAKQPIDEKLLMNKLGGTKKVAVVLEKGITSNLVNKIVENLTELDVEGKITFGISAINIPTDQNLIELVKQVKFELQLRGIASRYVLPKKGSQLSSVQVEKTNLVEFYLIWEKKKLKLAKTLEVQPFEQFSNRDFNRPYIDPRGGMLPPKVARMMLNLALPGKLHKSTTILDPFCGTGTIGMEALSMNIRSINSDFSQEKCAGTTKNLSWLSQQQKSTVSWKVLHTDATHVSELLEKKVDAIVTEPYLGPPSLENKNLENIVKGLDKLYIGCLREWSKCLKKGGCVVIVLPQYHLRERKKSVHKIIDMRENLGYTLEAGPFDYERQHAKVRRKIAIFRNNRG